MQNTYIWKVVPSNQPKVIRSCPKCGNHSEYESSGNFRVNANQNHIDVWLIYQCNKCKSTWNMEILSRINSGTIEKDLYIKFLRNDNELANLYAFDLATHRRNKSNLNYDHIAYDIIGDKILGSQQKEIVRIELLCDYPLDIRLDKILSKQFGISRELIKRMGIAGNIMGEGIKDIGKAKLKNGMKISFHFC
ncbi:MAG: DUF1062 domain-containing protein [Mobilitalea sp.]